MIDVVGFVHAYPYLSIGVLFYIFSELLPRDLKFRNLIALVLQLISLFSALYQFNLLTKLPELFSALKHFLFSFL